MRFYYLTITLFLQALNLIAQPADAIKLSSEQIALIQNEGAIGIQTVFTELGIQFQDLPQVEEFAYEVVSVQINASTTAEMVSDITSEITVTLAELALSQDRKVNGIIEYISAGACHGVVKATQENDMNLFDAIKAASTGSSSGAVQFAVDAGADIAKVTSAAASGSLSGAIEATNADKFNVIMAAEASSSGLISGAIKTSTEANIDVMKTVESLSEGIAEAAVEASIKVNLELIPQVKAAASGAAEEAILSARDTSISFQEITQAISSNIDKSVFHTLSGNGENIRIIIESREDIDVIGIRHAIDSGIFQGGKKSNFVPLIETPYDDKDPTIHKVSPT